MCVHQCNKAISQFENIYFSTNKAECVPVQDFKVGFWVVNG